MIEGMIDRRALLAMATGALASPALAQGIFAEDGRTLRALAAAKGLEFGSATATYELKDQGFATLMAREAGVLVAEYEMKRNLVEPQPGAYDFSATDALMNFATVHGMAMRGHPLVWYAANPPWLEQAVLSARDEKPLADYVTALARRYRGRMQSWDVVNEALATPDAMTGGTVWRDSFWLKRYGPSYIDMAFHAAHAADPKALLVYNDWGCEQGAPANDRFRAATLNLLDGLLKRGVPIGALGLQAHLSAFGTKIDQKKLRAFLQEIRDRHLAVLVTELDVDDEGGPADLPARDRAVADEAARFLDVALDSPATRAVLTWGLSDRYLDPPDSTRLKLLGWRDRKVPFDSDLRRKPFWDALARAFAGRRVDY
jgi:endo-1,4-beta-xylanase